MEHTDELALNPKDQSRFLPSLSEPISSKIMYLTGRGAKYCSDLEKTKEAEQWGFNNI